MKIKYSIATYDRKIGNVDWYTKMPMDGVDSGVPLPMFLASAGKNGWRLCAAISSAGIVGSVLGLPESFAKASGKTSRKIEDSSEVVELIFSREE